MIKELQLVLSTWLLGPVKTVTEVWLTARPSSHPEVFSSRKGPLEGVSKTATEDVNWPIKGVLVAMAPPDEPGIGNTLHCSSH